MLAPILSAATGAQPADSATNVGVGPPAVGVAVSVGTPPIGVSVGVLVTVSVGVCVAVSGTVAVRVGVRLGVTVRVTVGVLVGGPQVWNSSGSGRYAAEQSRMGMSPSSSSGARLSARFSMQACK